LKLASGPDRIEEEIVEVIGCPFREVASRSQDVFLPFFATLVPSERKPSDEVNLQVTFKLHCVRSGETNVKPSEGVFSY
jgi:hypothetical protein